MQTATNISSNTAATLFLDGIVSGSSAITVNGPGGSESVMNEVQFTNGGNTFNGSVIIQNAGTLAFNNVDNQLHLQAGYSF